MRPERGVGNFSGSTYTNGPSLGTGDLSWETCVVASPTNYRITLSLMIPSIQHLLFLNGWQRKGDYAVRLRSAILLIRPARSVLRGTRS